MWLNKTLSNFFRRSQQNEAPTTYPRTTFDSMSSFGNFLEVPLSEAMKFTAVFAAMRLRAENIASMPKTLTRKVNSGKEEAVSHPIYRLLKYEPNSYMNVFSFWEYINACLDGWGNSYVLILRDTNGVPVSLIPIHPSHVTVTLSQRKKWFRVVGTKTENGTYTDEDLLHFFTLSLDGIKGVNPISYNSLSIQAGIASTTFGNEFFSKGGNIKAVLENDKAMSLPDFKLFQQKFNENKNHETALLDGGWKYKAIGIAPEAAQMLQTRTFCIQDIARIFNVPPHMLAELSRSTFSNIEHQDIQFVKYSLRPTIKRYETEIDRKLLFSDEVGIYEMKFNLDGLLRGDMKTRAAFYHYAILDGWLNRNEVRQMEHRNQVDGLDEYLYPSNQNITGKEFDTDGSKENK